MKFMEVSFSGSVAYDGMNATDAIAVRESHRKTPAFKLSNDTPKAFSNDIRTSSRRYTKAARWISIYREFRERT
jgi:hypothetical protein